MKLKNIFNIFLFTGILFAISLSSCQKKPINGWLDGEWEVMEVTPAPPQWDQDLRIFYNFSRTVCQLTVYGGPFTAGNMVYDGEFLYIDFPLIKTPEEELTLKQYGIYSNPVSFKVEFDGKKRLILSNDQSLVILRKF